MVSKERAKKKAKRDAYEAKKKRDSAAGKINVYNWTLYIFGFSNN